MKKEKVVIVCMFFVLAILISLYLDSEIVKGFSFIRSNFLNEFFMGITFISSGIIIFFFLTGLFLWQKHKRKYILPLWFSLGLSALISFLLKVIVQRQRPFQLGLVSVLPVLEKVSHAIWNFSFPSFQTMLMFCAIPLLSKKFPKLKYYWIAFAVLVGFSRIYFGLHFLSDVIAGGLIGYFLGWIVIRIEQKKKFGERIFRK